MFEALVNIRAPQTICSLDLSVPFDSNDNHVPINEDNLSHFYKFANVERLVLTFDNGYDLNNKNLRNIAKQFPFLKQLSFGPASPLTWNVGQNPSLITFPALFVIAKEFPELKDLLLPMNVSGTLPSIPDDFTSQSRLTDLTLDPRADLDFSHGTYAAYLVRLFPHLHRVRLARPSFEEKTWAEVSGIMEHLIEARERGRKEAETQSFK
ncbi:hypothetical protein DL96DRAFT_1616133 [Flagelloscypha sp. PMI_526]|nr:hypothetical protein DL96DRAFT_1616133 [Flagelloscypha sp. PMI_526]